ncbi:MAG TPA: hypothetical protein VJL27_01030 [Patescibacteria group bacterium]|nr:hypothetical protein [Patescibacteria group bacterium]
MARSNPRLNDARPNGLAGGTVGQVGPDRPPDLGWSVETGHTLWARDDIGFVYVSRVTQNKKGVALLPPPRSPI